MRIIIVFDFFHYPFFSGGITDRWFLIRACSGSKDFIGLMLTFGHFYSDTCLPALLRSSFAKRKQAGKYSLIKSKYQPVYL
jgi:hypothetical protein